MNKNTLNNITNEMGVINLPSMEPNGMLLSPEMVAEMLEIERAIDIAKTIFFVDEEFKTKAYAVKHIPLFTKHKGEKIVINYVEGGDMDYDMLTNEEAFISRYEGKLNL